MILVYFVEFINNLYIFILYGFEQRQKKYSTAPLIIQLLEESAIYCFPSSRKTNLFNNTFLSVQIKTPYLWAYLGTEKRGHLSTSNWLLHYRNVSHFFFSSPKNIDSYIDVNNSPCTTVSLTYKP